MTTEFEQRLQDAIERHGHPGSVVVVRNDQAYGPRVKLTCKLCPGETYIPYERPTWLDDKDEAAEMTAQAKYIQELMDLETTDSARATILLGPFGAMALIGLVQLATRHPDLDKKIKDVARDIVRQLSPLFTGTPGEEIIRRGGHPEFDL